MSNMAFPGTGRTTLALTAGLAWLSLAGPVQGAEIAPFPRGPGLYLNPSAVVLVLLAFFGWVRACGWVDRDARRQGLEVVQWNVLVFFGGVVGFFVFWVVPIFLLAYPVLLLSYLSPLGFYVQARNPRVPPERQVWTGGWFKKLFRRHLRVELPVEEEPSASATPVRLRLRPRDAGDEKRLRKLKDAPGYSRVLDLLSDAVRKQATDVKLSPVRRGVAVEYRIDGVPHAEDSLPRSGGESALQLLKTLAGVPLFDSPQRQQGNFSAEAERRRIDFRLSTPGQPGELGELSEDRIDLRVVDRSRQLLDLSLLGMSDSVRRALTQALSQSRGLLLICGPDDSGKTTTAHACLNEIDRLQRSVFVVGERPEVRLPEITYRKAGEDLAADLKNVLKQRPNVVLVGDVPDQDTAELICQAAKKSLVLAELPAADAVAGLFQFLELGVRGSDLAEVLLGVVAGRLLRALCPTCKLRYLPPADGLRGIDWLAKGSTQLYRAPRPQERRRATGGQSAAQSFTCPQCGDLGYYGRVGIYEYLLVTERIRGLLRDNPLAGPIRQEAVKAGLQFLADGAMRLVAEGTMSVEEVLRVMR